MVIDQDRMRYFLEQLQREDGGYADTSLNSESSVNSTNSVVKVLGHVGWPVANAERIGEFIDRCLDKATGGFAQAPGAEANAFATASALIVLHGIGDAGRFARYWDHASAFMNALADSQYDHFMVISAYDECGIRGSSPSRSIAYFEEKGEMGRYGNDVAEVAIAVASLLRLGRPVKDPEFQTATLLAGQCSDGGFGPDGASDLFTSYCVLRALVLLAGEPGLGRLSGYVDRLERTDGYTVRAGEPSSAGATYMALTLRGWIGALQKIAVERARAGQVSELKTWLEKGGDPNLYDTDGWTPLLAGAAHGHAGVVDLLLNHGLDVPRADPDMSFLAADALPLYMAGQSGNLETVKLLLAARPAHLHAISRVNGHTVFLQAAFYGKSQHLTLAAYLLDNCCAILGVAEEEREAQQRKLTTATNVRGYTGLTMQDLWHNQAMVQLLRHYPQPSDAQKAAYLDALLLRIAGSQALTERLIEQLAGWQGKAAAVADADYVADGTMIRQALAAVDRIIDLPEFEIDRLGSPLYQTPLIYAITGVDSTRSGADMRHALVRHLLDRGADPRVIEKHPMAIGAVIRASVLNQFGLLQLIAEYLPAVDLTREMNASPAANGLTAMHDAVHRAMSSPPEVLQRHLDQIAWMRDHGARIDIPDHTGQTQEALALSGLSDDAFPRENVLAVLQVLGIDPSSTKGSPTTMTHEEARAAIEPFYNLFSATQRDWDKGFAVLADDWKSYYGNTDYRNKEDTRVFLKGFFQQIPDIEVVIKHISVDGDFISVRSELTGTPVADSNFWGKATGKSFRIMTIDFNRVSGGKLVDLYHSEDWLTAQDQLKA